VRSNAGRPSNRASGAPVAPARDSVEWRRNIRAFVRSSRPDAAVFRDKRKVSTSPNVSVPARQGGDYPDCSNTVRLALNVGGRPGNRASSAPADLIRESASSSVHKPVRLRVDRVLAGKDRQAGR